MAEAGADRQPSQRDDEIREADIQQMMRRRGRIAAVLTVIMLVTYYGFVLLWAAAKDFLGELITDGLSVGIVLGVIVILVTWAVTFIYVRWANRSYEPEVRRLRR